MHFNSFEFSTQFARDCDERATSKKFEENEEKFLSQKVGYFNVLHHCKHSKNSIAMHYISIAFRRQFCILYLSQLFSFFVSSHSTAMFSLPNICMENTSEAWHAYTSY